MKKKLFIKVGILFLLIPLLMVSTLAKGDKNNSDKSLNKVTGTPSTTRFNINKLATYIYGDGRADIIGSNPGYFYPTLGGHTANFQSGFLWGGYVGDPSEGQLKVGGSTYRTSLTAGRILPDGTPEDPNADNVRIYRVRKDYKTGSLSQEAQDEGRSIDAVYNQYDKDWKEWPADKGAPFDDVDGDRVYNPDIDIPGVPGADQTIWFVANDLSTTAAQNFYGTTPMGIELQCTVWGYKQSGALGQMLFKKYLMVNKNKNQKDFTQFYVSYWSDTDIGGGSNDFSACDTTKSLFYTYESGNDNAQYGATPPATGFDFFQGPIIATGNAADTAIFKGKFITGYKNLPMTVHYFFINGSNTYRDPDLNSALGTQQWHNLFRGKISTTGADFVDPISGNPTKFTLYGNPLTGTGWLDSDPGDRRNGGVSGPFTLAYGDTQEVVIAQMSAGATPGVDHLGAVKQLFQIDGIAQVAYNRLFQLPAPAPIQTVRITELNRKFVLNWGWDLNIKKETESFTYQLSTPGDTTYYEFQGYNVYQLRTPSASLGTSDVIRLKTYDIVDTVTSITDLLTDPVTGLLLPVGVQNGTNSGLTTILIDSVDVFTGKPFLNGSTYYFAVTSYSYNPNPQFGSKVLENPLVVVSAVPHSNNPGVIYTSSTGDSLAVKHASGNSDGQAIPIVVDPTAVTGHNYEVSFQSDQGDITWSLNDVTAGKTLLSNQSNQSGDADYIVADGIFLKVLGPSVQVNRYTFTPAADRWFTGNADLGGEAFFGGLTLGSNFFGSNITPDQYVTVEIRFVTDRNNGQRAYRYLRGGTPNYSYQDYEKQYFTVWDVDANPPVQISAAYVEQNGVASANQTWQPTATAGDREYLFILKSPYTENPDAYFTSRLANSNADEFPTLYGMWPLQRGTMPFNPQDGQVFTIIPNYANTVIDKFTFTAPEVIQSASAAAEDIKLINVFPNPYYGINPQETNKYNRFVTFSHLPQKATIRIFNLAGQLVKTIVKDSPSQFQPWDLLTDNNFPASSGLYIAYIDLPELGKTKILKVAIIQEQQILDHF